MNKLIDGRNKRFNEIENNKKKNMKDIDQRSKVTLTSNLKEMECFKLKAQENLLIATNNTNKLFSNFKNILENENENENINENEVINEMEREDTNTNTNTNAT